MPHHGHDQRRRSRKGSEYRSYRAIRKSASSAQETPVTERLQALISGPP
jgi:hypothetical protein